MRAEIKGIFNGVTESSFDNSNGDSIKYKTVTLLHIANQVVYSRAHISHIDKIFLK